MAVTKTQRRAWIDEIVEIKCEIDELQARKHEIAAKLGYGTHRSTSYPLLKVLIKRGGNGWRVDWKSIVGGLAVKYKLNVDHLTIGHRHRTHRKPSCAVISDKAKAPRSKAA